MRGICLPKLIDIYISNYSLYLTQPSFRYQFINGVNLVIGVNGIGKTTFTSLIKYALIGAYKKDVDVRVYREQKRENRIQYSNDYFKSRMTPDYENNDDAFVELTFEIADTVFTVRRSLFSLQLESVLIKDKQSGSTEAVKGIILRQDIYHKAINQKNVEKNQYLQYNYEELVAKKSNFFCFDDFIFFVNEILFFGEERKTILWDDSIQERVANKYLNDMDLDREYEDAKRDAKYYDSRARHKSEDIRAITQMINKLQKPAGDADINQNDALQRLSRRKEDLEKAEVKLNELQKSRKLIGEKIGEFYFLKESVQLKIRSAEENLANVEKQNLSAIWGNLTPQYQIMLEHIRVNHSCPFCNKALESDMLKSTLSNTDCCFFCGESIHVAKESDENASLRAMLKSLYNQSFNLEADIIRNEKLEESYDLNYDKIAIEIRKIKSDIRLIEHTVEEQDSPRNDNDIFAKMRDELLNFEHEKNEFQKLSDEKNEVCNKIISMIDDQRRMINNELSTMFSKYANRFLGVDAELTYTDSDTSRKMYLPVINGIIRRSSDELSESQRFFVDHSFRMSILNYFYQSAGLFMCETPESSLDISYESNAADTFLQFLQVPNVLVLTSNLNNSAFLVQIIEKAPRISFINLLKYGNPSTIQRTNKELLDLSRRVEELVCKKNSCTL